MPSRGTVEVFTASGASDDVEVMDIETLDQSKLAADIAQADRETATRLSKEYFAGLLRKPSGISDDDIATLTALAADAGKNEKVVRLMASQPRMNPTYLEAVTLRQGFARIAAGFDADEVTDRFAGTPFAGLRPAGLPAIPASGNTPVISWETMVMIRKSHVITPAMAAYAGAMEIGAYSDYEDYRASVELTHLLGAETLGTAGVAIPES